MGYIRLDKLRLQVSSLKLQIKRALALLLSTLSVLGDAGSVNFANGSSVGNGLVTDSRGIPLHSSDFVAQLFYSEDGVSYSELGAPSPFKNVTATSVRAGVWGATTLTFPSEVKYGETLDLKVAVWDSKQFASWDDTAAAIADLPGNRDFLQFQAGITSPFAYTVPLASDLSASDYNLAGFTGLQLTDYSFFGTSEPSTIALSVFGSFSLAFYGWMRGKTGPWRR